MIDPLKSNLGAAGVLALLIFALGYGAASWRYRNYISGADGREQNRMAEVAERNAAYAKLLEQNVGLRKDVAMLGASEEALKQIIEEHGGNIAKRQMKLELINENLSNEQAVIFAPADRCIRCQRLSANALATKLIYRPLACSEECAGG